LDPGDVVAGPVGSGTDVPVCVCLREGVKGTTVILLTSSVTLLLFVYLLAALLRPEWF
jgi:K+-transporting ATPase KdpF subunit